MSAPMLRPADVAQRLNIPASTLRRWSYYFADYLPTHASEPGGAARAHRRYSDEDVQVLAEIKDMLGEGLTYEAVAQHLAAQPPRQERVEEAVVEGVAETIEPADEDVKLPQEDVPQATRQRALVNQPEAADDRPELAAVIAETLFSLSDSQQIILSGQQTTRQLLGVVLQDNFNLKEENSRLRERILETERKLFELKRELDANQTQERERMRQMESYLFELQRRLDSLAPPVVRHAAPAAAARPAPPPPTTAAPPPVVPPPASTAPTSPAPTTAAPPAAAVPAPSPQSADLAPAEQTALMPSQPAAAAALATDATPVPEQIELAPVEDVSEEPISPFAPPRPGSSASAVALVVEPADAPPVMPPAPPPVTAPASTPVLPPAAEPLPVAESLAPVAAVLPPAPEGASTPAAPMTPAGRWQRFTDWLFGRNLEE